jgi:hypothetical protein
MNGALAGRQFTGSVDLLNGTQAFLDEIHMSELEHAIHDWIEGVQGVLDNDGGHLHDDHSSKFWLVGLWPVLSDRPIIMRYSTHSVI